MTSTMNPKSSSVPTEIRELRIEAELEGATTTYVPFEIPADPTVDVQHKTGTEPQPELAVKTHDEAVAEIPFIKIYASSMVMVTVVSGVFAALATAAATSSAAAILGMAAMTAIWIGPAFGAMLGSARVAGRLDKIEHLQDH